MPDRPAVIAGLPAPSYRELRLTTELPRKIFYAPAQGYLPHQEEDEIELWNILWDHKWFTLAFVTLCTAAAALISLYVLTPKYEAKASLQGNKESKSVIANVLGSNKLIKRLTDNYVSVPIYSVLPRA